MVDNGLIYFARKGVHHSGDGDITAQTAAAGNTGAANSGGENSGIDSPGDKICMRPDKANRHGFICGATGTGKSVTLKVLAESFSGIGVPVFMSDVKGDMAGIAAAGTDNEGMQKRIDSFGIREYFEYRGCPVSIFDIYEEKGTPLRTTVSEMGPQLLAQVLDLNDTQTELMQVVFKIADDLGLVLTDTKDMKAMLQYCADHSADFKMDYGLIPQQSVSAVIRSIVALEAEGADKFFGEPAVDIRDLFMTAPDGRGMVNILDAETLISRPRLYSAFMLYLLSELFEVLPEIGDPERPTIVFFFDEAHLLFKNASRSLLEKIEQVVKLIRSKGVSIFFVTQSPGDIPNAVMAQLGNKIEHGLRAYTPAEQRVVKAAADSFRVNPEFDTEELIMNLGTGEAVVSMLDEKGAPGIAEHVFVLPPESRMGALTDEERREIIRNSPLNSKYETMIDDVSAYEVITGRVPSAPAAAVNAAETPQAPEGSDFTIDFEIESETREIRGAGSRKVVEVREVREVREIRGGAGTGSTIIGGLAEEYLGKAGVRQVARSTGGTIGREIGKSIGEAVLGKKGKTIGGNIGSAIGRNLFGTLVVRK